MRQKFLFRIFKILFPEFSTGILNFGGFERNDLLSIFLPFCFHFSFFLTSFFLFICSWCFTSHSRMIFFTNFKILFINIIAVLNIIGHKTLWKRRSLAVKLIFKASGSAREHRDALKITWYGNSRKR